MRRALRNPLLAVVSVTVLGLSACGSSGSTTTTGSGSTPGASASSGASAPTSDVKVGLAYDIGGRGDKSFNDAAAMGLDEAKNKYGVTAQEVSVNDAGTDRVDRLTLLADGGYNPIVAVGFLYADAVKAVATKYPNVKFAIVDDSSVQLPNVTSLIFAEQESSFLVGAAAGLKTKTNNVGFIGGVQTDLLQKFEAGFTAGVKQTNPGATVQVKYLTQPPDFSGFGSPDKGKIAAQGMYDNKADIVYTAAGGSGAGAFEAAVSAGKLAIGVDSDQYQSVPAAQQKVIITSALKRVDTAVSDFVGEFVDGKTKAGPELFNLANDGVGYATSGGQVDDIKSTLDDLKQQIIDGKITVPTKP